MNQTQTNKLQWWMILKISLRAKAGVPEKKTRETKTSRTLSVFPSEHAYVGEFSDLHSILDFVRSAFAE